MTSPVTVTVVTRSGSGVAPATSTVGAYDVGSRTGSMPSTRATPTRGPTSVAGTTATAARDRRTVARSATTSRRPGSPSCDHDRTSPERSRATCAPVSERPSRVGCTATASGTVTTGAGGADSLPDAVDDDAGGAADDAPGSRGAARSASAVQPAAVVASSTSRAGAARRAAVSTIAR